MRYVIAILLFVSLLLGCSTKKNTQTTRMYHEVNTRYNVYFNANEAYKENLKSEIDSRDDNLSKLLDVYPTDPDIQEDKKPGGSFDVTVDKTTKAIKLHSITAKPKRDPSKKKSQEYQLWLQQQEFNPFLKNAWLLLGKGEYQNKDYLLASSTFAYIIRLYRTDPEVVMEAQIWLAKCYLAMGWIYETEDIFHNIELAGGVSENMEDLYAEIYADLLVKKKEYDQAIPYIKKAIAGSSGTQKLRLKYLLGQVYALLGNKEEAYQAFQDVQGMNTPYKFIFNSKIQQAAFVNDANRKNVLSELNKMTGNSKNKEYLDQVYYAIGNVYLTDNDTLKAIDAYKKGVEKSTRNGYDKAITQVRLGDIYFNQQNYIDAQPPYSEALSSLDKKEEAFSRVEQRSLVLDELVVYLKAIHLQDSLQSLAQMPEDERLKAINKVITALKEKEKKEKQLTDQSSGESNDQGSSGPMFEQNTPNIPTAPITTGGGNTSFYFYNTQLVEQGKSAFQRKWGNRKQEDNWRRQNKQVSMFENRETEADNSQPSDSTSTKNKEELSHDNDPHFVEYYLKQIPFTPEALKKSNEIIEDAYFNSGLIYKDKLDNYTLAIEAFNKDLERFADTPNKEEIYYQLFLIYLRLGNKDMTETYRRLILNNFADGDYAATLRSSDYEWNLRNIYKLQDNLYTETYDSYMAGNIDQVRANYKSIMEKYPLSELMPKFMYLNALTYAQSKEPNRFKEALTELVQKYPKSDVTPTASEMLKGLLDGRTLSSDNSMARGMMWDMKFTSSQDTAAAGVDFIAKAETEYLLLFIYPSQTVDKNQLIYDIANYNFSKFVYKTFDLSFNEINGLDLLQVRGFDSLKEISDYIDLAFDKGSLMDHLDPSIITVPISADNYIALMNGKTLNEYFTFFEKNYTREMVKLVILWNQQRAKAKEESELPANLQNETEDIDNSQTESPENKENSTDLDNSENITTPPPVRIETIKQKEPDQTKTKSDIEIGVSDILSDDVIDKADDVINKTANIISNPIDGLKNLFNSSKDEQNMTKEEKEEAKRAKKEEKEKAKTEKKAEEKTRKALEQAEEEKEKAYNDSIKNAEKLKAQEEKAVSEAKKQELEERTKNKEDAKKAREEELKQREQERKDQQKQREQERKEIQKQRQQERQLKEQERKEQLKQREQERKEIQKQREQELKQREQERKEKQKQREQERKK